MTNHRSLMTTTALSGAMAVSALMLGAGAAQAATASFNNGANITIATQSLNAAGTVSLSQASQTLSIVMAAGDSCAVGNTLTLTAPTGVTFSSVPNIAFTANVVTPATATGTIASGSSSVVYTFAGNTVNSTNNSTITLGGATSPFFLTTGTTLSTASTTAKVFTVSTTCTSFVNGTTMTTGLTSASGFTATNASNAMTVDTTATGAGRLFTTGANSTTRVGTLGTYAVANTAAAVDAGNGTAYVLSSGASVTTVLTGAFSAASRVYAVASPSTCVTTAGGSLPSGAVTGTITGSTATLTGMSPSTTYTVCYENNGSTVIQAGAGTAVPITAVGSVSNLSGVTSSSTVGTLQFSGTAGTINYVTGGSAYQYFVRVTNPGSSTSSVFAVVTKEDGTALSGSLNTSLGANTNALYSITDVNTATGANLTAADRARIQVLTSQSGASVTGLLFNTATGVVAPAN